MHLLLVFVVSVPIVSDDYIFLIVTANVTIFTVIAFILEFNWWRFGAFLLIFIAHKRIIQSFYFSFLTPFQADGFLEDSFENFPDVESRLTQPDEPDVFDLDGSLSILL